MTGWQRRLTAMRGPLLGTLVWWSAIPIGRAQAQDVTFRPLLAAREASSLLVRNDIVLMGLDTGGLVVWERSEDPVVLRRIAAGDELTNNRVTDIADSGRYVWVATDGGGLTRIGNLDGDWEYRGFSTVLAGLELTAVAGDIVGDNEWVFYAIDGEGIGRITNGIVGATYTAEQDGLISDSVLDLVFYGDELFVATTAGVSRFVNNVFVDANDGLPDLYVNTLALDVDGSVIAGTRGGVARWDPIAESWTFVGTLGSWVIDVVGAPEGVWALGVRATSEAVLGLMDGDDVTLVPVPEFRARVIAYGDDVWVGGRTRDDDMSTSTIFAYLARRVGTEWRTRVMDAALVTNADGVTFDARGRAWLGSRVGDGLTGYDDGTWYNIYRLGTEENGFNGLYDHSGGLLGVGAELDGAVWFGQFNRGLVRFVPADVSGAPADSLEWVNSANSPLQGHFVERIITHPQGPLIFTSMSHQADVLIEPAAWADPSRWVNLTSAELGGQAVADVVVERADVLWLAIPDQGLMRWDVNGDDAGPNEPLTWTLRSDDTWRGPATGFVDATYDLTQVVALERAPDGTIWVGGGGVARFSYEIAGAELLLSQVEAYGEKTSSFVTGLLAQGVVDIAVDRNGHLWAWTVSGLNRVRSSDDEVVIDAFTDLATYVQNSQFAALYLPSIISPLLGGESRKLAANADGSRLLASSSFGGVLIDVAAAEQVATDPLGGLILYPNPFPGPDGDPAAKLAIRGVEADDSAGDPATVEIYDLQGQIVYRNRFVTAGVGFWDGENRFERPVASGLYLVKVSYRGTTTLRTLAVER